MEKSFFTLLWGAIKIAAQKIKDRNVTFLFLKKSPKPSGFYNYKF